MLTNMMYSYGLNVKQRGDCVSDRDTGHKRKCKYITYHNYIMYDDDVQSIAIPYTWKDLAHGQQLSD